MELAVDRWIEIFRVCIEWHVVVVVSLFLATSICPSSSLIKLVELEIELESRRARH